MEQHVAVAEGSDRPDRTAAPAAVWVAVAAATAATALGVVTTTAAAPTGRQLTAGGLESYVGSTTPGAPVLGAAVAVSFAVITVGLLRRSRLARAWTGVSTVLLLVALVSGLLVPGLLVATALAVVATGLLTVVPSARSWFAAAPARPVPTSIAVVRVSVLVAALFWLLAALVAVAAVVLVSAGPGDGRIALRLGAPIREVVALLTPVLLGAALLCLVVGGLYLWLRAALGRGSRVARVIATVLFAGHAVGLVAGTWSGTTAVAVTLQIILLVGLRVASDGRRHFGGQALSAVEDRLHRLLPGDRVEPGRGAHERVDERVGA